MILCLPFRIIQVMSQTHERGTVPMSGGHTHRVMTELGNVYVCVSVRLWCVFLRFCVSLCVFEILTHTFGRSKQFLARRKCKRHAENCPVSWYHVYVCKRV